MKIRVVPNVFTTTVPVIVYLISIIASQLFMDNVQLSILLQLLIGMVCFALTIAQFNTPLVRQWVVISVFFSFLLLLSLMYNGNSKIYHILYIWGRVGAALLFYYSRISERVLRWIFFAVAGGFMYMALSGVAANNVLLGASRNGINAIIIFYALCCYVAYDSEDRYLPYLYSIIAFVISLWSEGRSGVIVTAGMVAFVIINNFFYVKERRLSTFFIVLCMLGAAYWFSMNYFLGFVSEIIERFEARGMGSLRFNVWAEYFDSLMRNILNVIFGSTTGKSTHYYMHAYSGNLHNSFFMLHSKFGFLGFVCVVFCILKSIIVFTKHKKQTYLFVLIFAVIRSFFDWVSFPGYYDFLYVILFVFMMSERRNTKAYSDIIENRKIPVDGGVNE